MNINALTAYLALSSGSYSGILRDMYAVHNLGLNPDLHTKLLANRFVGVTKELSGIPPLSFTAKGKPLTAWSITGNTVQNGTLTPENPVEVLGCGDYDSETGLYKIPVVTRGKNLLKLKEVNLTVRGVAVSIKNNSITVKGTAISNGGRTEYLSEFFVLQPGTYFISGDIVKSMVYCLTNKSNGNALAATSSTSKFTLTEKTEVAFGLNFINGVSYDTTVSVMLNEGNKILPYEPYQEPITTPIYLPTPLYSGEVMRSDGTITRSDGTTETFTAPQIPTLNGTTVIDVDTAVKPESMTIKYRR